MNIQDYGIVIEENSTLADRLKLRQVLLDNKQEIYSALESNNFTNESILVGFGEYQQWSSQSPSYTHKLTMAEFIAKFKKHDKVRNLAFYKKSGENWTRDESETIAKYCGQEEYDTSSKILPTFIFDRGPSSTHRFMHSWTSQSVHRNFKHCQQVAYEDVFPEKIENAEEMRDLWEAFL